MMKTKDEVLGIFLKWKVMIETQSSRKMKYLRTDNGGEYKNDLFQKICEENGIVRHFTVKKYTTTEWSGRTHELNFAGESSMYVVQYWLGQRILG